MMVKKQMFPQRLAGSVRTYGSSHTHSPGELPGVHVAAGNVFLTFWTMSTKSTLGDDVTGTMKLASLVCAGSTSVFSG